MMLPSSVRRVVAPAAGCLVPSVGSSVSRATASLSLLLVRGHQRRCSSSKPSRSDNGSGDVASPRSVPASSSASPRREAKTAAEKRRRKSKDSASDSSAAIRKLPSVPNTHHMSQEALGLSSFFSLHRPISVTQTMPRAVSDDHFASIFRPRSKADSMADAMSTLSNTIEQLDGPMAQLTLSGSHDDQAMADGMQTVEVRNPDGSRSSIHLQVDTMSGDFLPFRPPPSPEAQSMDSSAVERAAVAAHPMDDVARHRVYKAMFTIEESMEPDGQIRIVAHSPRIVNEEPPRSFLERMALRQLRLDESRAHQGMHAISVKRQRKLKMKKKKYKKLMKRTRNLRRKLDRA